MTSFIRKRAAEALFIYILKMAKWVIIVEFGKNVQVGQRDANSTTRRQFPKCFQWPIHRLDSNMSTVGLKKIK